MGSPARVAILAAKRTPLGKFLGSLSKVPAVELGRIAAEAALSEIPVQPADVDEVIFGNCIQAGLGQNPARQVQLGLNIPFERGAVTVNKVCGSGLESILLGCARIKAGEVELVLAGGMESMSLAPYLLPRARTGLRYGDAPIVDSITRDSLEDAYGAGLMGVTAEGTARRNSVSREEQDRFALRSNQLAARARSEGNFRSETVPVPPDAQRGIPGLDHDEGVRGDTTLERLGRLRPVFQDDGTVTAGNSSQLSDGAAALVLASEAMATRLGLVPLAWIHSSHSGGVEPVRITESPIPTVRAHLAKTGFTLADLDLVEINEAFAASTVAFLHEIPVPDAKFNVNGGAIALGHPIGCSGARIIVTLAHALRSRKAMRGLASLCMGGGNGLSLMLENPAGS